MESHMKRQILDGIVVPLMEMRVMSKRQLTWPMSDHVFDFDDWMTLAQEDPDCFEAMRKKCIDDMINQVPEEKRVRLRGLQWKIDQTRKLNKTPMASCIAISNMMWDSLSKLNHYQQELVAITTQPHQQIHHGRDKAEVIQFYRSDA
jgi:hypothetical protein